MRKGKHDEILVAVSLRNVCLARCTFLLWAAYYIRWLISLYVGVGDAGLL